MGVGGDVSSVTGIGTGGGAGSSNAPHGSSSSAATPHPAPEDSKCALSNSSEYLKERPVSECRVLEKT